jgi:DNA repair exonuclease SbcCD ATPase subunit
MTVAEVKAHQEKISAQLHEAKALIEEFEAHARKHKAQAEIEKITSLKSKRQGIEKKLHQLLKTAVEAKAAVQMKAGIDAELDQLKTSLEEVGTRLKSQSPAN